MDLILNKKLPGDKPVFRKSTDIVMTGMVNGKSWLGQ